jgi:hypothetical protein
MWDTTGLPLKPCVIPTGAPEERSGGICSVSRSAATLHVTSHQKVSYAPRRASYKTVDSEGTQALRLNFKPVRVTAGQTVLTERKDLNAPGYTLESTQSDFIVRLRHTGSPEITLEGSK